MRYWASLATHGPRIDASLLATVETILRFDPAPERVFVNVAGKVDAEKATHLMCQLAAPPFPIRVIETDCRGSGKKIWPTMRRQSEDPNPCPILTVDDDCYYQPDLPQVLARGAAENPGCLVSMTVWGAGTSYYDEHERRFHFMMTTATAGQGDGPNGAAGVWYEPGLGIDWREIRRWSYDPRTEMSDDIFIGGECRRLGIPVVAVGGLYRYGIRPHEGAHANDSSALYRDDEIRRRALNGFCLQRFMAVPASLRGSECDPDARFGSEPVFLD